MIGEYRYGGPLTMHGTARRDSKLSSSGPFRSSDSLNSLDRAHRTRVGYGTPSPSPFEGDSLHGRSGVSGNSSNRRKRLWNPLKMGPHSGDGASRLAALLLPQRRPEFSAVAAWPAERLAAIGASCNLMSRVLVGLRSPCQCGLPARRKRRKTREGTDIAYPLVHDLVGRRDRPLGIRPVDENK